MLDNCWSTVYDDGQTLMQQGINDSCLFSNNSLNYNTFYLINSLHEKRSPFGDVETYRHRRRWTIALPGPGRWGVFAGASPSWPLYIDKPKHSHPSFLYLILMHTYYYFNWLISLIMLMGWVLNQADYICCFVLFCTCQYNKLIELNWIGIRGSLHTL